MIFMSIMFRVMNSNCTCHVYELNERLNVCYVCVQCYTPQHHYDMNMAGTESNIDTYDF